MADKAKFRKGDVRSEKKEGRTVYYRCTAVQRPKIVNVFYHTKSQGATWTEIGKEEFDKAIQTGARNMTGS